MAQWRARVELPIEQTTPAVARQVVRLLARAWGLERSEDNLALVTSELVTNVFIHTPKADSFDLELIGHDTGIRLSIADGSTIKPVIRELDPDTPTGRGLRMVQSVASRWGSEEHEGGKRVWVELA